MRYLSSTKIDVLLALNIGGSCCMVTSDNFEFDIIDDTLAYPPIMYWHHRIPVLASLPNYLRQPDRPMLQGRQKIVLKQNR